MTANSILPKVQSDWPSATGSRWHGPGACCFSKTWFGEGNAQSNVATVLVDELDRDRKADALYSFGPYFLLSL